MKGKIDKFTYIKIKKYPSNKAYNKTNWNHYHKLEIDIAKSI